MYNKTQILSNADQLAQKIKNLEMIKEYQSIESQIHNNKAIENKMNQLKKQQKQSVNLQNMVRKRHFTSQRIKYIS